MYCGVNKETTQVGFLRSGQRFLLFLPALHLTDYKKGYFLLAHLFLQSHALHLNNRSNETFHAIHTAKVLKHFGVEPGCLVISRIFVIMSQESNGLQHASRRPL